MIEIFAFVIAVFVLIKTSQLRAILAIVFPQYSVRQISICPPESAADLYNDADKKLQHEGFEGPFWLKIDTEPKNANESPVCAVYKHPELHVLAWLMLPSNADRPNNLNQFYTSILEDDRIVTTQVYDIYFQVIADDKYPATTIYEKSIDQQLMQHLSFVDTFDSPASSTGTTEKSILYLAGESMNKRRQKLISSGQLWKDKNGTAKAKLKFSIKLLRLLSKMKKVKPTSKPVPPERLTTLAIKMQNVKHREPGLHSQIGIFATSILLSVIAGAAIWDIQFATVLLAVVTFHELGHYAAMRVFGYKNVHMMALPLVGGVTIGFDVNPNAWRQAWMSLMGPLPGIILGWVLLFYFLNTELSDDATSWLRTSIFLLLFINYLNILPVLPLDGGHVVRSLLPPRYLTAHAILIITLCSIGIATGLYLQIYILPILCTLYLFTIKPYLHAGTIVKHINDMNRPSHHAGRLLQIFRAYENTIGPATNAKQRINHAEQILDSLENRPMTWTQRTIVGTTYSLLLIVPVATLTASIWYQLYTTNLQEQSESSQAMHRLEYNSHKKEADRLTTHELITELSHYNDNINSSSTTSSPETIHEVEKQLNITFPDNLRDIYTHYNGASTLSLIPFETINYVKNIPNHAIPSDEDYELNVDSISTDRPQVTSKIIRYSQLQDWLYIRTPDSDNGLYSYIYLNPANINSTGKVGLIEQYEDSTYASGYTDVRHWITDQWINAKLDENLDKRQELLTKEITLSLRHRDMNELLDMQEKPSLIMQAVAYAQPLPEGSEDEELGLLEDRFHVSMPADMKSLYKRHNGFPLFSLLPLDEITNYPVEYTITLQERINLSSGQSDTSKFNSEDFSYCYMVGGRQSMQDFDNKEFETVPSLIWCPRSTPDAEFISLPSMKTYHSLTDFVREKTINLEVSKQLFP